MPDFFRVYLASLNNNEADQLAKYFDEGNAAEESVEALIKPRPALHEDWNWNPPGL